MLMTSVIKAIRKPMQLISKMLSIKINYKCVAEFD